MKLVPHTPDNSTARKPTLFNPDIPCQPDLQLPLFSPSEPYKHFQTPFKTIKLKAEGLERVFVLRKNCERASGYHPQGCAERYSSSRVAKPNKPNPNPGVGRLNPPNPSPRGASEPSTAHRGEKEGEKPCHKPSARSARHLLEPPQSPPPPPVMAAAPRPRHVGEEEEEEEEKKGEED